MEKIDRLYELEREMEFRKSVFAHDNKHLTDEIKALRNEIKIVALENETDLISNNGMLTAKITKGRETWDTKALVRLSETIPSLLEFKKVGSPSVKFTLKKQPVKTKNQETSTPKNEEWK